MVSGDNCSAAVSMLQKILPMFALNRFRQVDIIEESCRLTVCLCHLQLCDSHLQECAQRPAEHSVLPGCTVTRRTPLNIHSSVQRCSGAHFGYLQSVATCSSTSIPHAFAYTMLTCRLTPGTQSVGSSQSCNSTDNHYSTLLPWRHSCGKCRGGLSHIRRVLLV